MSDRRRLFFDIDKNYVTKIEDGNIFVFSRISNRYLKPYLREMKDKYTLSKNT
jgi:hypothetical protein